MLETVTIKDLGEITTGNTPQEVNQNYMVSTPRL